jgi:hypothetical protein
MGTIEKRRVALAGRLGVVPDELQEVAGEGTGTRFQLQPGGCYWVYSPDEEKQAFKTRVPDVPFLGQIRDVEGKSYNVFLEVDRKRA